MHCSRCGADMADGASWCSGCGLALVAHAHAGHTSRGTGRWNGPRPTGAAPGGSTQLSERDTLATIGAPLLSADAAWVDPQEPTPPGGIAHDPPPVIVPDDPARRSRLAWVAGGAVLALVLGSVGWLLLTATDPDGGATPPSVGPAAPVTTTGQPAAGVASAPKATAPSTASPTTPSSRPPASTTAPSDLSFVSPASRLGSGFAVRLATSRIDRPREVADIRELLTEVRQVRANAGVYRSADLGAGGDAAFLVLLVGPYKDRGQAAKACREMPAALASHGCEVTRVGGSPRAEDDGHR